MVLVLRSGSLKIKNSTTTTYVRSIARAKDGRAPPRLSIVLEVSPKLLANDFLAQAK